MTFNGSVITSTTSATKKCGETITLQNANRGNGTDTSSSYKVTFDGNG